jgi:hypothetical protein
VTSFEWSSEPDVVSERSAVDFTLIAVYHDSDRDSISTVRVRCSDVKQLKLPELGAAFFLTEIELEDISIHQLEGVRYRLKDFGESQFEVLCGKIELTFCDSGV